MKLDKVTLTGADDYIDPKDLIEISAQYPFVEWGILMATPSNVGGGRFPSQPWINDLLSVTNPKVNLCAHLCGAPVRNLLAYGELPDYVTDAFQRIQVNTHGEDISSSKAFKDALALMVATKRHFIFQCDGVNDDLVKEWVKAGIGEPLFDTSSGAGVLPEQFGESWPKIWDGVYCGYAGGLGPLNVVHQVDGPIREAVGDGRIWIDMETKVRANYEFSLAKCKDVLKKMSKFIE